MDKVELRGTPIPLDNGYVIYSALSSICPILHELKSIGIHPIAGIPTRNNLLELTAQSRLKIRIYHWLGGQASRREAGLPYQRIMAVADFLFANAEVINPLLQEWHNSPPPN